MNYSFSTSYAYVIQMEIGTPPQKLDFLIDTGSANMAIAGPECQVRLQDEFAKPLNQARGF